MGVCGSAGQPCGFWAAVIDKATREPPKDAASGTEGRKEGVGGLPVCPLPPSSKRDKGSRRSGSLPTAAFARR